MAKGCGQVRTPDVDNTLSVCDDIIPSSCIVVSRVSTVMQNMPDEPLDTYLGRVDDLIESLIYRITLLEESSNEPIISSI